MRGTGAIWHALNAARHLNLAEDGAALPRIAEPGLTRRRLVAGLAATAGAAFLPRQSFAATPRPNVAIVGGGIAGLVALDTLVHAGIDAQLYEARAVTGGRIRTTTGVMGRDVAADDGGQLVNSDHAEMRALCKRFGLSLVDRRRGPSRDIVLSPDGPVKESDIVRALRPLAKRIAADAQRVDDDSRAAQEFDHLSAAEYLDRAHAQGMARRLLESSIRTEYGVEPGEASARELLWNLPTIDGEHLEVLGASDERYAIAGGSQRVTDALTHLHKARIHTGRVIQRIADKGGRVTLFMRGGQIVQADRVIVAVPGSLYQTIKFDVNLPAIWRAFLAEITLGRVEKLIAGFDSRPWLKAFGPAGSLWAGGSFAEAWDASAGQPDLTNGALAFFTGGAQVDRLEQGSIALLAQAWTAQAGTAVPGLDAARNDRVRRTSWSRDPFTRGGYVNYRPGQLSRFAPLLWTPKPGPAAGRFGRLSFVGEHMSDAFPGYMNGGAETGRQAAETIITEARRAHAA